jgi:hypothetical protein
MARPCKYDFDKVIADLKQYTKVNDDPQLIEFCLDESQPSYDYINEMSHKIPELSQAIKDLFHKQQVFCLVHPVLIPSWPYSVSSNHNTATQTSKRLNMMSIVL